MSDEVEVVNIELEPSGKHCPESVTTGEIDFACGKELGAHRKPTETVLYCVDHGWQGTISGTEA
jgi:hypothetical protein